MLTCEYVNMSWTIKYILYNVIIATQNGQIWDDLNIMSFQMSCKF